MECVSERVRPAEVRSWKLVAQRKSKADAGFSTTRSRLGSLSTVDKGEAQPTVTLPPEGNIAAIDFGTTYCSLAITTEGDKSASCLKLDNYHPRVPTAILLRKTDPANKTAKGDHTPNGWEITAFGIRAQELYAAMKAEDASTHLYFERVKMNLQHDQVYRAYSFKLFIFCFTFPTFRMCIEK